MKWIQIEDQQELEKKFYMPLSVKLKCVNCGEEMERDFDRDYLLEPVTNSDDLIAIYCKKCDTNHVFTGQVGITFSYDPETLRKY